MSFADVAGFKDQLIRKALQGTMLVADYSDAALTTISGASAALTIPPAYVSMGKLNKDGATYTPEQEINKILGWGDSSPSRQDVESENITIEITAIETKKRVLEVFNGVDLSAVVPDTHGEIAFDRPLVPNILDYRVLLLAKDVNKANGLEIYYGLHFPRANFTVNGGQQLQAGENALEYPMTVTALSDSAVGTAVRTFLAGPGLAGLVDDMDFGS